MADIADPVLALDFDLACTVRLNQHDAEQVKASAKLTAAYCISMFNGTDLDSADGGEYTNLDPDVQVW